MNNEKYYFAVDLGATSGRTILGILRDGKLEQEELTRFPNNIVEMGGHFYWDIYALYFEMIRGLKEVARREITLTSVGIDTWGVDFVLIGEDNTLLGAPMCYRDPCTFNAMDDYLSSVLDKQSVYDITGIQLMNFNTLFQLHAMRKEDKTALKHAKKILFIPDALSWMLTGEAVCEYTVASTSQMLDPQTGELSEKLLNSVGLNRDHFGRMVQPGEKIGVLTEEVQKMTGLGAIPVIAVAGHDTGSAVAAIPAKNRNFAYLSSGTWSLMGIETAEPIIKKESYERNFTNEGGIEGTTRFLKNICGMWLYERCRKEWPEEVRKLSHPELQQQAMTVDPFRSIINPDDKAFANPTSMLEAIQTYCKETKQAVPKTPAEFCRCIFDSLALRYRQVFEWLKDFAPFDIDVLHIIGGGSLNKYLNQATANSLGIKVLTGPQEGTAIGNIMLQAKASGVVEDIWEMREIISNSIEIVCYEPMEQEAWDVAYKLFLNIINK